MHVMQRIDLENSLLSDTVLYLPVRRLFSVRQTAHWLERLTWTLPCSYYASSSVKRYCEIYFEGRFWEYLFCISVTRHFVRYLPKKLHVHLAQNLLRNWTNCSYRDFDRVVLCRFMSKSEVRIVLESTGRGTLPMSQGHRISRWQH
jgi:hypothetical protein